MYTAIMNMQYQDHAGLHLRVLSNYFDSLFKMSACAQFISSVSCYIRLTVFAIRIFNLLTIYISISNALDCSCECQLKSCHSSISQFGLRLTSEGRLDFLVLCATEKSCQQLGKAMVVFHHSMIQRSLTQLASVRRSIYVCEGATFGLTNESYKSLFSYSSHCSFLVQLNSTTTC